MVLPDKAQKEEISCKEAVSAVEELLKRGSLTKIQEIVFRESWLGRNYLEIALAYNHSLGYIKDVASELWREISQALGEKVTKNKLHRVLEKIVQQQNITKNKPQPNRHNYTIIATSISPDGQLFATCYSDNTIKILHLSTRKCIETILLYNTNVLDIAFYPIDKILLIFNEDNTIKFWNIETGCFVQIPNF
ncbi:hypothetical protein PN478_01505 [Dolichospermum circinale CS-534/05]|uniref:WD40 repeat domain-containing protein n=1 Tax=Dolichospermum circinale TaxID=109265 RepID=UPI00232B0D41|nr:hypothetical protein [Dolichospermum circinale]MDB9489209.1 hypothetical protein [Dolichospermum circinale CS-534/05]